MPIENADWFSVDTLMRPSGHARRKKGKAEEGKGRKKEKGGESRHYRGWIIEKIPASGFAGRPLVGGGRRKKRGKEGKGGKGEKRGKMRLPTETV